MTRPAKPLFAKAQQGSTASAFISLGALTATLRSIKCTVKTLTNPVLQIDCLILRFRLSINFGSGPQPLTLRHTGQGLP